MGVMGTRTLLAPFTVRGEHFHTAEDGRIVCDPCPRQCRLHDGQRGFVREAEAGALVLSSYGRASGFCVDPGP
jgi:pyruvate formate lyase activating enzyme